MASALTEPPTADASGLEDMTGWLVQRKYAALESVVTGLVKRVEELESKLAANDWTVTHNNMGFNDAEKNEKTSAGGNAAPTTPLPASATPGNAYDDFPMPVLPAEVTREMLEKVTPKQRAVWFMESALKLIASSTAEQAESCILTMRSLLDSADSEQLRWTVANVLGFFQISKLISMLFEQGSLNTCTDAARKAISEIITVLSQNTKRLADRPLSGFKRHHAATNLSIAKSVEVVSDQQTGLENIVNSLVEGLAHTDSFMRSASAKSLVELLTDYPDLRRTLPIADMATHIKPLLSKENLEELRSGLELLVAILSVNETEGLSNSLLQDKRDVESVEKMASAISDEATLVLLSECAAMEKHEFISQLAVRCLASLAVYESVLAKMVELPAMLAGLSALFSRTNAEDTKNECLKAISALISVDGVDPDSLHMCIRPAAGMLTRASRYSRSALRFISRLLELNRNCSDMLIDSGGLRNLIHLLDSNATAALWDEAILTIHKMICKKTVWPFEQQAAYQQVAQTNLVKVYSELFKRYRDQPDFTAKLLQILNVLCYGPQPLRESIMKTTIPRQLINFMLKDTDNTLYAVLCLTTLTELAGVEEGQKRLYALGLMEALERVLSHQIPHLNSERESSGLLESHSGALEGAKDKLDTGRDVLALDATFSSAEVVAAALQTLLELASHMEGKAAVMGQCLGVMSSLLSVASGKMLCQSVAVLGAVCSPVEGANSRAYMRQLLDAGILGSLVELLTSIGGPSEAFVMLLDSLSLMALIDIGSLHDLLSSPALHKKVLRLLAHPSSAVQNSAYDLLNVLLSDDVIFDVAIENNIIAEGVRVLRTAGSGDSRLMVYFMNILENDELKQDFIDTEGVDVLLGMIEDDSPSIQMLQVLSQIAGVPAVQSHPLMRRTAMQLLPIMRGRRKMGGRMASQSMSRAATSGLSASSDNQDASWQRLAGVCLLNLCKSADMREFLVKQDFISVAADLANESGNEPELRTILLLILNFFVETKEHRQLMIEEVMLPALKKSIAVPDTLLESAREAAKTPMRKATDTNGTRTSTALGGGSSNLLAGPPLFVEGRTGTSASADFGRANTHPHKAASMGAADAPPDSPMKVNPTSPLALNNFMRVEESESQASQASAGSRSGRAKPQKRASWRPQNSNTSGVGQEIQPFGASSVARGGLRFEVEADETRELGLSAAEVAALKPAIHVVAAFCADVDHHEALLQSGLAQQALTLLALPSLAPGIVHILTPLVKNLNTAATSMTNDRLIRAFDRLPVHIQRAFKALVPVCAGEVKDLENVMVELTRANAPNNEAGI